MNQKKIELSCTYFLLPNILNKNNAEVSIILTCCQDSKLKAIQVSMVLHLHPIKRVRVEIVNSPFLTFCLKE